MKRIALAGLMAAASLGAGEPGPAARVVFVCEHGSAKSVIAAAHFNRLARQRGLAVRAEARGTHPDEKLPPAIVDNLRRDGLDVSGLVPRKVSAEDVEGARKVVTLGCDLAPLSPPPNRLERWDDVPPVSAGYPAARDAILQHVEALVATLEKAKPR